MEKAAGEGAPARAIERRQPEREEHGEGYERKKRGRLPPGALREPQRQMPQAPNRPGGKTGREKRNSSLKLRLQDRSPPSSSLPPLTMRAARKTPMAEIGLKPSARPSEAAVRRTSGTTRNAAVQGSEHLSPPNVNARPRFRVKPPGINESPAMVGPKTPTVWITVPMGLE